MTDAISERRLALVRNDFVPVALHGKVPPMKEWQKIERVSSEMIAMWAKVWPTATNTGALTRLMPTLDIDILNEEAARAIEELAREKFEERGWFLVRVGQAPKRAIIFRCLAPFRKIVMPLISPNGGNDEKLEFLADGQQVVVHGRHPSGVDYRWFGGEPWRYRRDELPRIHRPEAQQLIDNAATLLTAYGYTRTAAAPKGNGGIAPSNGGEAVWKYYLDNIRHGRSLHDSITQLAAALIRTGMQRGAVVHLLAALLELSDASHDERWEARYRYVPRAVDSAIQKYQR